ncbi:SIS domain-containing protein [Candidatus Pseudothioglobus singularis]|nr:SIS domain-containing protein [Candidatus Pseudothioglobus singularis]
MNNFFKNYFNLIDEKTNSIDFNKLILVSKLIEKTNKNKGKIIIAGNGGSAAIASHASIDFTKAAKIRSINFNESSLLTCFSNDYGYENWTEKAIEFYADSNDLAILISSSGQSKNIINAALKAKEMGVVIVTLSGFSKDNKLRTTGDINLWVDCSKYNIVETVHQTWILSIIDYLIHIKE